MGSNQVGHWPIRDAGCSSWAGTVDDTHRYPVIDLSDFTFVTVHSNDRTEHFGQLQGVASVACASRERRAGRACRLTATVAVSLQGCS